MVNIFEVFLPQLMRYPNPSDPLNGEAAALLMREPKLYEAKVKGQPFSVLLLYPKYAHLELFTEYVTKYATKQAADEAGGSDDEDEEVEEMSDVGSLSDHDDEVRSLDRRVLIFTQFTGYGSRLVAWIFDRFPTPFDILQPLLYHHTPLLRLSTSHPSGLAFLKTSCLCWLSLDTLASTCNTTMSLIHHCTQVIIRLTFIEQGRSSQSK